MKPNAHDDDPLETLLTASYDRLRQPDATQRQMLLAGISERPARTGRRGTLWRPWPVGKLSLATAACILALIGVRLLAPSATGTVYGVEAVGRRMCEVQTICIRGWKYFYDDRHPAEPAIRIPVEYVVKRPDKFRSTSWGVSYHDKIKLNICAAFCDGRQTGSIDDTDKAFQSEAVSPLDARLETEFAAQRWIAGALAAPAAGYKKTGEGHCNGRKCDLYEGQFALGSGTRRSKLWFDPTTGYPLRLTDERLQPDGSFRPESEFEEILVNVPLADELFQLAVPAGYQRRGPAPQESDPPPPVLRISRSISGGDEDGSKVETWRALRVADNAALVIWRRSPPEPAADGTRDWLSNVEWGLGDGASGLAAQHAWIYNSRSPDVWSWSLVVITGGRWPDLGEIGLLMHARQSELCMSRLSLRLPDDQLRQVLAAAAGTMLPAEAPRFSLEEMRAKAEELSRDTTTP